MNGTKLFALLLIGVGLYSLKRTYSGEGFLGLTNPKWPGFAVLGLGLLIFGGILKI